MVVMLSSADVVRAASAGAPGGLALTHRAASAQCVARATDVRAHHNIGHAHTRSAHIQPDSVDY